MTQLLVGVLPLVIIGVHLLLQFGGFLLPPVMDYIGKDVKDDNERFLAILLLCFIYTCLIDFQDIKYGNLSALVLSMTFIFTQTQVMFKLYWKKSTKRTALMDWILGPQDEAQSNPAGETTPPTQGQA